MYQPPKPQKPTVLKSKPAALHFWNENKPHRALSGKIYCDLDGVLADFDRHYARCFGVWPSKAADNVDWNKVRNHDQFFYGITPMHDMDRLWRQIQPYGPTILTGCPSSVDASDNEKHEWVRKHLGDYVPVICCRSREKYKHCKPGDLLIDDWEKYQGLWLDAGGVWVTHVDAESTIKQLAAVGIF